MEAMGDLLGVRTKKGGVIEEWKDLGLIDVQAIMYHLFSPETVSSVESGSVEAKSTT
jgi:hypothetical protein